MSKLILAAGLSVEEAMEAMGEFGGERLDIVHVKHLSGGTGEMEILREFFKQYQRRVAIIDAESLARLAPGLFGAGFDYVITVDNEQTLKDLYRLKVNEDNVFYQQGEMKSEDLRHQLSSNRGLNGNYSLGGMYSEYFISKITVRTGGTSNKLRGAELSLAEIDWYAMEEEAVKEDLVGYDNARRILDKHPPVKTIGNFFPQAIISGESPASLYSNQPGVNALSEAGIAINEDYLLPREIYRKSMVARRMLPAFIAFKSPIGSAAVSSIYDAQFDISPDSVYDLFYGIINRLDSTTTMRAIEHYYPEDKVPKN